MTDKTPPTAKALTVKVEELHTLLLDKYTDKSHFTPLVQKVGLTDTRSITPGPFLIDLYKCFKLAYLITMRGLISTLIVKTQETLHQARESHKNIDTIRDLTTILDTILSELPTKINRNLQFLFHNVIANAPQQSVTLEIDNFIKKVTPMELYNNYLIINCLYKNIYNTRLVNNLVEINNHSLQNFLKERIENIYNYYHDYYLLMFDNTPQTHDLYPLLKKMSINIIYNSFTTLFYQDFISLMKEAAYITDTSSSIKMGAPIEQGQPLSAEQVQKAFNAKLNAAAFEIAKTINPTSSKQLARDIVHAAKTRASSSTGPDSDPFSQLQKIQTELSTHSTSTAPTGKASSVVNPSIKSNFASMVNELYNSKSAGTTKKIIDKYKKIALGDFGIKSEDIEILKSHYSKMALAPLQSCVRQHLGPGVDMPRTIPILANILSIWNIQCSWSPSLTQLQASRSSNLPPGPSLTQQEASSSSQPATSSSQPASSCPENIKKAMSDFCIRLTELNREAKMVMASQDTASKRTPRELKEALNDIDARRQRAITFSTIQAKKGQIQPMSDEQMQELVSKSTEELRNDIVAIFNKCNLQDYSNIPNDRNNILVFLQMWRNVNGTSSGKQPQPEKVSKCYGQMENMLILGRALNYIYNSLTEFESGAAGDQTQMQYKANDLKRQRTQDIAKSQKRAINAGINPMTDQQIQKLSKENNNKKLDKLIIEVFRKCPPHLYKLTQSDIPIDRQDKLVFLKIWNV